MLADALDQPARRGVRERIEHFVADPSAGEYPVSLHEVEMLTDGILSQAKPRGEFRYRNSFLLQDLADTQPMGVRNDTQNRTDLLEFEVGKALFA
jgi:hypothetical protein